MALAKDRAILRDETGANWDAAFCRAFLTLLERDEEAMVCL